MCIHALSIFFVSNIYKSSRPAKILIKFTIFCVLQLPYSAHAYADIVVGMTTPLSGPLQAVGKNVVAGIDAYFYRVNSSVGVHGQQIRLIVKDDGYEPELAAPNMRKLIEGHDVIAVIGNVGTPTAIVTVPIAIENGVPFIGAITGAPLLRTTPPNRLTYSSPIQAR